MACAWRRSDDAARDWGAAAAAATSARVQDVPIFCLLWRYAQEYHF